MSIALTPEEKAKRHKERTKLSYQSFIDKVTEKFGNKFEYDEATYNKNHDPMTMRCIPCNYTFQRSPKDHLMRKGCPKCGKYKYLERHNKGNVHDNILFMCSEHGEISMSLWNHLNGHSCPCCKEDPTEDGFVYLAYLGDSKYKVGMTNDLYGRRSTLNSDYKKECGKGTVEIIVSFDLFSKPWARKMELLVIDYIGQYPRLANSGNWSIEGFQLESHHSIEKVIKDITGIYHKVLKEYREINSK